MSLLALRDALAGTGIPTYHFTASEEDTKYIVWLEEGERSYFRTAGTHTMWADDHVAQQAISGVINYVTNEEYDKNVDLLQKVFYDIGLSYSLSRVEYNRQLERIQYQWTFEMPVGDGIYSENYA
jgi:hypothetical protein